MELRKIGYEEFQKELYESYQKDFPLSERDSIHALKKGMKNGNVEMIELIDQGQIVSYAIFYRAKEAQYILLAYLATMEQYRGSGYGTKFIEMLKIEYQSYKGILIEIEKRGMGKNEKDNEIRQKRYRFYERLGFQDMPFYVKFPYSEMEILLLKIQEQEDPPEISELKKQYRSVRSPIDGKILGKILVQLKNVEK